jgi:hypothetical protein
MTELGFDRRRFLRGTAGLGLLAGTTALVGSACTRKHGPAGPAMQSFSRRQSAVLAALIDAALPADNGLPGGIAVGVLPSIDRALIVEAPALRSRLGDALLYLEWASQFSRRFAPFSSLPPDERLACFGKLGTSSWTASRTVHQALKGLITFHYADMAAIWPTIGYDGPWVGRPAEAAVPAREFGR